MSLTRETVLIWFYTEHKDGLESLALLAFPKSRRKDLESRLSQAAVKKSRGHRLENLSWNGMQSEKIPFVLDFLQIPGRIASLEIIQAAAPVKSASWQIALTMTAEQLKKTWPDAQFEVFYDPACTRHSLISSWMKTQQIAGKSFTADRMESIGLQTAGLIGSIGLDQILDSDPKVLNTSPWKPVYEKYREIFSLTPRFAQISPSELMTSIIRRGNLESTAGASQKNRNRRTEKGKNKNRAIKSNKAQSVISMSGSKPEKIERLVRRLFQVQPQWFTDGILERWLKKGLDEQNLTLLVQLAEEEISYDALQAVQPERLSDEADALRKESQPEPSVFQLQEFHELIESQLKSIEDLARTIVRGAPSWRRPDHPDHLVFSSWKEKARKELAEALENWMNHPQKPAPRRVRLQITQEENGFSVCISSNAHHHSPVFFLEHSAFKPLIEWLSTLHPLPEILCDRSGEKGIRRILFERNAFLPLCLLQDDQDLFRQTGSGDLQSTSLSDLEKKIEQAMRIDHPAEDDWPYSESRKVSTALFSEVDFSQLNRAMKKSLLQLPLPLHELRPAARLMIEGVAIELIEDCVRTPGRLEDLESAVLYPRRAQRIFAKVQDPAEKRFLIASQGRPSQLEALHRLFETGTDFSWIRWNYSHNMSASKIRILDRLYPGKRLPSAWSGPAEIPESIVRQLVRQVRLLSDPLKAEDHNHTGLSDQQLADSASDCLQNAVEKLAIGLAGQVLLLQDDQRAEHRTE